MAPTKRAVSKAMRPDAAGAAGRATAVTATGVRASVLEWWRSRWVLLALFALVIAWTTVYAGVYYGRASWFTSYDLQRALLVPATSFAELHSSAHLRTYWWGSYRPQVYFGLRTREPQGLLFGMMWLRSTRLDEIRHTCEQGDKLRKYGWTAHDGKTFGDQEIQDNDITLKTSFVKNPGTTRDGWAARIIGETKGGDKPTNISLFFYLADESRLQVISQRPDADELPHARLARPEGGSFAISRVESKWHRVFGWTPATGDFHNLTQQMKGVLQPNQEIGAWALPDQYTVGTVVVWQLRLQTPFEVDVLFRRQARMTYEEFRPTDDLTDSLQLARQNFQERFDLTFGLKDKGFNDSQIQFAQAALSNMIGGIGYFYGSSKVATMMGGPPKDYGPMALLTAVPSRSFFPRGFLWDEGFHQLLVSRWDRMLSIDIIAHWLDMMNRKGWIPREQILGAEALSKVPAEFVVQRPENANPPTMLLPLLHLVGKGNERDPLISDFLKHISPRVELWIRWYVTTQAGPVPSSFRWRGRDATSRNELNPKTLTSGLDDYPRASHPSNDERHVDLLAWMSLATDILRQISPADSSTQNWAELHARFSDVRTLDQLHWDDVQKVYADWGNHTEDVLLARVPPHGHVERVLGKTLPTPQFVPHVGYVSLFPLMMTMLDPSSPKLGDLLSKLTNRHELWTEFGLRSLSKTSSLYMRHNTEHDAPYWRGPIWINMNFMVLRGLHHYRNTPGPHQQLAGEVYEQLRSNVVNNIYREYQRTGFLWENYHPDTGRGQGCHPFTGWTSLVVLMMAELY